MSLPALRATYMHGWPERTRLGRDLAQRLQRRSIALPAWLSAAEVHAAVDVLLTFLDTPPHVLTQDQLAGLTIQGGTAPLLLPGEQGEVAAPPSTVTLSQRSYQPGQRRLDLPIELVWLRDAVIDCVGLHFNGQRLRDVAGWTRRVADTPATALTFLDAAWSLLLRRPHIADGELFTRSLAALLHDTLAHVDPLVVQWVLALASKAPAPERLVGTNAALLGQSVALRRAFEAGLIRVLPDEDGQTLHWRQPFAALGALSEAPGKPSLGQVMEALASLATGPERDVAKRLASSRPPRLPLDIPSPSPAFTGREEILQRLTALLEPADTVRACVLHGSIGIGKSEVAAALCQRLAARFEPVWLSSSAPERSWLRVALALDIDMNQPASPGEVVPSWVREAQERLKDGSYLLIAEVDRWDGVSDLAPWLPSGRGSCAVLVLSRHPLRELEHTHDAIHLRMGALSIEESRRLLARRAPELRGAIERGHADPLIERLGNHPAALSLVAPQLREIGIEATEQKLSAGSTGEAALDPLLQEILAHLPPDELSLLRDVDACCAPGAPTELLEAMSGAPDFRAVLDRLQERSLLIKGSQRVTNHSIVSLALHRQPEPEDAQHARHRKHAQAISTLFQQAQTANRHDQQDLLYPDLKLALTRAAPLEEHQGLDGSELAFSLANAISTYPRGQTSDNLQQAIAAYQAALTVRTREHFPQDWAMTQNNLGIALKNLPTGDRADNLQQAIAAYQAALTVYTREHFPQDWAMTQNNLGNALKNLPTGDRADNLQQAIAAYQAALTVYTREHFPQDWAMTQNNLGIALADLPTGDRADNLQQAIAAYQAALTVYTREHFPQDWAMTQNNLGIALEDLPTGDCADNLQQAIAAYQAALTVRTREHFPQDWATTQNNLGTALQQLPIGDRADNLQQAISAYQAALTVLNREHFPQNWATTQNNLGTALQQLPIGDRADNLQQAISAYQAALTVRTREHFPEGHAQTSRNLERARQALEGLEAPHPPGPLSVFAAEGEEQGEKAGEPRATAQGQERRVASGGSPTNQPDVLGLVVPPAEPKA